MPKVDENLTSPYVPPRLTYSLRRANSAHDLPSSVSLIRHHNVTAGFPIKEPGTRQ